MMKTDPHGDLLTVDQAATRLNVSTEYVRRRLIFEKRIPYVKIGRHLRIDSRDLELFIDGGRVAAGPSESPYSSMVPYRKLA